MKKLTQLTKVAMLFSLLLATTMTARNYYVATNGNNSNNGSEGRPWKTIQKAAGVAGPGDQVFIKRGTYFGNVNIGRGGTSSAWVVYRAFPGHERQVILNNAYFSIIRKSNVRISGIKVQNGKHGFYIEGPNVSNIEISDNHTYNTSNL